MAASHQSTHQRTKSFMNYAAKSRANTNNHVCSRITGSEEPTKEIKECIRLRALKNFPGEEMVHIDTLKALQLSGYIQLSVDCFHYHFINATVALPNHKTICC